LTFSFSVYILFRGVSHHVGSHMDFLPTLAELGIKILPGKIYNLYSSYI